MNEIQMIEDLNIYGMSYADIGREMGYTSNKTVSSIKRGEIKMGDAMIKKLTFLHERIMRPKDVKENEDRWDALEKELDKKLTR